MAEPIQQSRWGALPKGETHQPAIKAGTWVRTPKGQAFVLWIHQDHQWEFGRRVQTQTWVGVRDKHGHKQTFRAEQIRSA